MTIIAFMKMGCLYNFMVYHTFQVTRLNDPGIRSTSVGSVSGFSSARALAQLYNDAVLAGQNNKSTSISKQTWTKISQPVNVLESNNFAVQLGLISNWTKSAAGQVRTSPKVRYCIIISAVNSSSVISYQ